jgi:hypothetical protein
MIIHYVKFYATRFNIWGMVRWLLKVHLMFSDCVDKILFEGKDWQTPLSLLDGHFLLLEFRGFLRRFAVLRARHLQGLHEFNFVIQNVLVLFLLLLKRKILFLPLPETKVKFFCFKHKGNFSISGSVRFKFRGFGSNIISYASG